MYLYLLVSLGFRVCAAVSCVMVSVCAGVYVQAEFEVVRQIKEQACYIAFNPQKEESAVFDKSGGGYPFQLPDGTTLSVGFSV